MGRSEIPVMYKYWAELVGTFLLILIGDGVMASVILSGGPNFGAVVFGWSTAVITGAYVVGGISGAHLNPAVTLAMAASKRLPWRDVIPYIVMQVLGAFLGAVAVYAIWYPVWNIVDPNRTKAGIAAILHCFYPNPGFWGAYWPTALGGTGTLLADVESVWPLWQGFLCEVIVTGGLLLTIVAVTDADSPMNTGWFAPIIIALYVFGSCVTEAPITMYALNPARDNGPRIFAALLGYGSDITYPSYRGQWWVFTLGPIVGAIIAVFIYDYTIKPFFKYLKK